MHGRLDLFMKDIKNFYEEKNFLKISVYKTEEVHWLNSLDFVPLYMCCECRRFMHQVGMQIFVSIEISPKTIHLWVLPKANYNSKRQLPNKKYIEKGVL